MNETDAAAAPPFAALARMYMRASSAASAASAEVTLSRENAQRFVLAISLVGLGLIVCLTAVTIVLVLVVRRLDVAVGMLRHESGTDVRKRILNAKAENPGAAPKKKKRGQASPPAAACQPDGCCDDEYDDENGRGS